MAFINSRAVLGKSHLQQPESHVQYILPAGVCPPFPGQLGGQEEQSSSTPTFSERSYRARARTVASPRVWARQTVGAHAEQPAYVEQYPGRRRNGRSAQA